VLIPQYLGALPPEAAAGLISTWISGASDPVEIGELLLQAPVLNAAARIMVYRDVSRMLDRQMQAAAGNDRSYQVNRWINWNRRFAKEMLETGVPAEAAAILQPTLEQTEENNQFRPDLVLMLSRAQIRTGETDKALMLLQEYVEHGTAASLTPRMRTEESTSLAVDSERYRRVYEVL
jgi:hypothetical protein